MGDSRRAAQIVGHKMRQIIDAQKRVIFFLLSIIFASGLSFLITNYELNLTTVQTYVVFILFLAIALWVTEAIPPFAVGLLIVGLLIFLIGREDTNVMGEEGYIDVKQFVQTWSNSVIWLMLGGFFLAEGLRKTRLDYDLFKMSISVVDKKPKNILFALMLATGIASMIMSNTATTAMMIASIMPFINTLPKGNSMAKALLIGIPAAASIGGMGTIIGSPPNAIAVDAINTLSEIHHNIKPITFLDWMIYGIPTSLVLIVIFWLVLTQIFKLKNIELDLSFLNQSNLESKLDKFNKKFVLIVLGITILLWLTSSWHGIPAAAVSGIPIILLPMVSIITGEDVRKLPWDTLMLVAGGLSLGLAIQLSGLADLFVSKLDGIEFNPIIIMLIFAFATVLFSNIMSNTATATILIPVATILPGVGSLEMALVIGLSASCALFLPVSTPPNAIAYSTGKLEQSDFKYGGISIGFLGPILTILWLLGLKFMNII
ncbi:Na(+)/dicarboxylate symporter [Candidatus Ornithobacterium hominis]|uniref:Na(+)/dicarboxylate symporter n=1 Tax=Candidatus Ornithobacterium hominis TaxID=2497989 RepID=A0A383TZ74_9FLAO|nr:DASS family sodium-coupled anion symporter [Candidatus Ornithobacterium hominis]MCT7904297.1 DASS family sodium-coupled anion symporter [Candidatus Ornithobacterium hominis]SZD72962.1 Na(+)/dicarboxylate symporter [Candidatus Ornithobacterium hominis]